LSSIKKLAGQTVWYGASSIFARLLNVLLTPYLTHQFKGTSEFGEMALVFSMIHFYIRLLCLALKQPISGTCKKGA